MYHAVKTKRVPFSFSMAIKKVHNGITHQFNNLTIEGWGKKKGRKVVADIDKIFLNNNELKGSLECLEGIDELETAAEQHVKELFQ